MSGSGRFRRALGAVAVATAAALAGTGVLAATPAGAAIVVPPVPTVPVATPVVKTFHSVAIDAMPRWERENTCSPTAKPGPRYLARLLKATYGPISSNIVRPCTAADSGHEEGRALDWMVSARVPAQKAMGDAFVAWLQAPDASGNPEAMARRLGIQYVIWNSMTWRAYDPARGWTEYDGCLHKPHKSRAWDNTCHRTHVHISFSWDGAYQRTSYYTGYVACPAPPPVWTPPTVPTVPVAPTAPTAPTVPTVPVTVDPASALPLPPVRVLGTQTGIGLPTGPCRVHPDVRLDLPLLGVGGVPASGVAAVLLRVTIVRPDAVAALRAWPAGAALPLEPLAIDVTGRVVEVAVPLGTGGAVSLQLSGAMAHLRVDVLGYVPAAA
jgi:hypothetical protein